MDDPIADLRRDYTPPFLAYLTHQDERGLQRRLRARPPGDRHGIGLLDLVRVHNEVYVEVASTARDVQRGQRPRPGRLGVPPRGLAPFEMTQRGFMAGDGLGQTQGPGVTDR